MGKGSGDMPIPGGGASCAHSDLVPVRVLSFHVSLYHICCVQVTQYLSKLS